MKFSKKLQRFWDENKGTIAIVTTISTVATIFVYGRFVGITNDFLDTHNLSEEFYGF